MTAFSAESYTRLEQDPADRSAAVLEMISLQLSSFSVNSVFINSTAPPHTSLHFEVSTADVAINILWFLSLTLSLMTALFAILVQQWIQQHRDFNSLTGRDQALIRQSRFREPAR